MGARTCVVVAIVTSVSLANADSAPPIEEAIKQAAAARKPLLVEFHAEWCGPCKLFEAQVLPESRVQTALRSVVFVRYDGDDSVGGAAAAKYGVDSYPTFLVIDSKGAVVIRHQGAPIGEAGIKQFIELIERAQREAVDEAELRVRMQANPKDYATKMIAAHWYVMRDRHIDAIALYESLSTEKAATAQIRSAATTALVRLRRLELWRHQLYAERAALVRASPATASLDDIVIATVGSPRPDEARKLIEAVIDSESDTDRLNKLVYVALAANAKKEALSAAKRIVAARADARYLDTLAEAHHGNGHREQAIDYGRQASTMATGTTLGRLIELNRTRFASGSGESSDVLQYRLRAEDLWKRLASVDKLAQYVTDRSPSRPAPDQRMAQMRKAWMAQHQLAVKVGRTCAKHAGDNEEAHARVKLDEHGKIASAVLLLEPSATKALRECLTKELIGEALPSEPVRERIRLSIDFKHR